ncbi:hypothetical protein [Agrobacterium vaccinii]|uniref:hypothetical protein n=1 Tax=Agrobacterium vaccinii TaxID=2735528 RepID=UPI001E398984|nr:hypothetical protein [Agrobacterium vaccinii]UHS59841.1 hypothetical protein HRS00_23280 [Agrobacterium vaccinii]
MTKHVALQHFQRKFFKMAGLSKSEIALPIGFMIDIDHKDQAVRALLGGACVISS